MAVKNILDELAELGVTGEVKRLTVEPVVAPVKAEKVSRPPPSGPRDRTRILTSLRMCDRAAEFLDASIQAQLDLKDALFQMREMWAEDYEEGSEEELDASEEVVDEEDDPESDESEETLDSDDDDSEDDDSEGDLSDEGEAEEGEAEESESPPEEPVLAEASEEPPAAVETNNYILDFYAENRGGDIPIGVEDAPPRPPAPPSPDGVSDRRLRFIESLKKDADKKSRVVP